MSQQPVFSHITPQNEGARLLGSFGRIRDILSQIADKKIYTLPDHSTVSCWLNGKRTPRIEWAMTLRNVFGIPYEAWVQPPMKASAGAL